MPNLIEFNPLTILVGCAVAGVLSFFLIIFYGEKIWLPERLREFMRTPRIIFIRYIHSMPQLVGRKWIKKGIKEVKNNDKVYILDQRKIVFSVYGNPIYFFDVDKCVPIPFGKLDEALIDSVKVMKNSLDTKIFQDYTSNPKMEKTYLMVIGVLIVAVMGIAIYGQYTLSQQSLKILELTKLAQSGGVVIK